MSNNNADRVLAEALDWPPADRAALARELVASLGSAADTLVTRSVFRKRMHSYI